MMLAAITFAAALSAQLAPEEPKPVAVEEVVGRPLEEVVARLGAIGKPAAALTIVEGEHRTEFYSIYNLTTSEAPGVLCRTRALPSQLVDQARAQFLPLAMVDQPSEQRRIAPMYLATRGGIVVAVINPLVRRMPARRSGESGDAYFWRRVTTNLDPWVSVTPGRLPLSDGSGFLDRRTDLRLPEDSVLVSHCQEMVALNPSAERATPTSSPFPSDDVGFFQGLALLPFAGRLPSLNAERRRARVEGPALLATLSPGEMLPGGLSAFLQAHPDVRRYTDEEDPDYTVLAINLGEEPSNNLSRSNNAALLGVRDGRVMWVSTEAAAALGVASALCVDREGRVSDARQGCTDAGFYSP